MPRLDQLSDPRISSSSLKIATAPIAANVIKDIPFVSASEAVTIISLSQIKAAMAVAPGLERRPFHQREAIAFRRARGEGPQAEDEVGEISPETLKKRTLISSTASRTSLHWSLSAAFRKTRKPSGSWTTLAGLKFA